MVNLPAFLAVAVLLVITPGPDTAVVIKNALTGGRRAALLTSLGIALGLAVWTMAAALGVASLLRASAPAFTILKLAGAAYLIFLGIQALLAKNSAAQPLPAPPWGGSSPFRQGLLSNLLNPKIALFFTSFIPQFINPDRPALEASVLLGTIFSLLGLAWLSALSLFASQAGTLLSRSRVRTVFSRLTGCVLVGFGLRLATERR